MKKFLWFIILVTIFIFSYSNRDSIVAFIMRNIIDKDITYGEANEYYRDYDYFLVQNTDTLYPKTKQDVLNIIYTTLNKGLDEIYFYCSYDECINDVNSIADDADTLSVINNLVHPYNSYKNIYFTITNYGRITLKIKHVYNESDILLVNRELNKITNSLYDNNTSTYDKIKLFHDYIVNNTIYDNSVSIASQMYTYTNASNAIGLLFEKKAICSGYSDTMAIFLNSIGINNYKISSDTHIWNLVNYDNNWLHIDATWDDPVTNDGSNILLHDFFMIDTETLEQKENDLNKSEHYFYKELYLEAKSV